MSSPGYMPGLFFMQYAQKIYESLGTLTIKKCAILYSEARKSPKEKEDKEMKRFYVVYHVRFMSEPLQKFDDLFKAVRQIERMADGGYKIEDFCIRIEEEIEE